ncbi:MAG: hypothetical protein ACFCD0_24470 [Gemmataceae bacterium]
MAFIVEQGDGIAKLEFHNQDLSPTNAELLIELRTKSILKNPEVRGRLMGPSCVYSSTIEIAYPMKNWDVAVDEPVLVTKVIIPEPSLWDPVSPFLYYGPLELWEGEECLARGKLTHGLRSIQMTPRGLRWNGKPMVLRGTVVDEVTELDLVGLREAGFNAIVLTKSARNLETTALADKYGIVILVQLQSLDELDWLHPLASYASVLGWIVPEEVLGDDTFRDKFSPLVVANNQLIGVEVKTGHIPADRGIAFAFGDDNTLSMCDGSRLPGLILVDAIPQSVSDEESVVGYIRK